MINVAPCTFLFRCVTMLSSGQEQFNDSVGDHNQRGDDRHLGRQHGQVCKHVEGEWRHILGLRHCREGRLRRGRPPPPAELGAACPATAAAGPLADPVPRLLKSSY